MPEQRETPLINMLVEREPAIPRGPIREQIATQEFALSFASQLSSSVAQSLVRAYLRGGMQGGFQESPSPP